MHSTKSRIPNMSLDSFHAILCQYVPYVVVVQYMGTVKYSTPPERFLSRITNSGEVHSSQAGNPLSLKGRRKREEKAAVAISCCFGLMLVISAYTYIRAIACVVYPVQQWNIFNWEQLNKILCWWASLKRTYSPSPSWLLFWSSYADGLHTCESHLT